MQIRYVSPETNEWYMSENLVNTAKQTMFIDTDKGSYIFSVPGVYTKHPKQHFGNASRIRNRRLKLKGDGNLHS